MTSSSVRSHIAGLGLILVAASVLAQTTTDQSVQSSTTQAPATQATPSTAPLPPSSASAPTQKQQAANPHGNAGGKQKAASKPPADEPMGHIPQAVLEQLALTPAQKVQFDAAQAARKDMRTNWKSLQAEQHKAMAEQFAKETIDPRALLAQRTQMRAAMEPRIEAVQQKWLAFWDDLSASQKTTLSNHMRSKYAAQTKKQSTAQKG